MADWTIRSALAIDFVYTGESVTFAMNSTGLTYTATTATGTRRVGLAPAASDLARLLAAAMTTAVAALAGPPTFAAAWGADGRYTITCTGDTWKGAGATPLDACAVGQVLGFVAADLTGYAASHAATYQPRCVAFFVSAYGGVEAPSAPVSAERTTGGDVIAFASGPWTHSRTVKIEFMPWTPARGAEVSSPATAFQPDRPNRTSYGVFAAMRAPTFMDLVAAAPNAACAWTLGGFQALRTSTSEYYDLGKLGPRTLALPTVTRQNESLRRYLNLELDLELDSETDCGLRA